MNDVENEYKQYRELIDSLLEKALKSQSETINLQFKHISEMLGLIHSEVKKTNGTVREHSKLINELKENESKHIINCPQKKEIENINNKLIDIVKIEVAREAVSKFTWKQIGALGVIVAIVLGILKFLMDYFIFKVPLT